jgi:DNA-binding transcriptional ArsR family regulator
VTRAIEAFAALGNETRLAILLALWEAYEPDAPDEGVSFSTLRERVGVRDSGRFNYHLEELVDRFVRETGDGYTLRRAGQRLVRTVIAGTGIEEPTLEPVEIDVGCPFCRATTILTYEDGRLYRVCTECRGGYQGTDERPDGYLTGMPLDPAGFVDRTPEELWAAALVRAHQDMKTTLEGVCDECSGPIARSLAVCEDHDPDPDGVCEACGRSLEVIGYLGCRVCKNCHVTPPRTLVMHHPAVVAFYHERGVALQYETDDFEGVRRRAELVGEHEQEVVSTDPDRVEVTVRYEGDGLRLTLDEELNVARIAGGS